MKAQQNVKAAGGIQGRGNKSGDYNQIILDLMREVTKTGSRFAHRSDLWSICQNQMSNDDFKSAINNLMDDGAIFTAVDDNTFGITD